MIQMSVDNLRSEVAENKPVLTKICQDALKWSPGIPPRDQNKTDYICLIFGVIFFSIY